MHSAATPSGQDMPKICQMLATQGSAVPHSSRHSAWCAVQVILIRAGLLLLVLSDRVSALLRPAESMSQGSHVSY